MDYEFFETFSPEITPESRPAIPSSAYKPVKRCPSCLSVFLTDTSCEACGRSLLYHPVGDPFSSKSLYGFKERYYTSFPLYMKYLPVFEDKTSAAAKSYIRQLVKRFDDLINAFGMENTIIAANRRYFYVEVMELIDELLRYGTRPLVIQQKIENKMLETGPLLTQELLLYLTESKKENYLTKPWGQSLMDHRIGGMRVEYILKVVLITATIVAIAVNYYEIISSQFGK
ncbi:MAG: hypothetical protein H7336_16780 [Bacteriovorax sp.]|nr:hypothetical protein [Bacteriovorax sp.]